jgi:hypothetical protein
MLKQMRKILGVLLVVCFLMSITVAAVSAEPADNTKLTDKNMNGTKLAKGLAGMKLVKGLSQGKDVHIKNLVIIRNLVIIKGNRAHPILRAAALKKLMTNKMNKTDMTDNMADNTAGTTDNTYMTDNTADDTADDTVDNTATDNTADNTGTTDNTT